MSRAHLVLGTVLGLGLGSAPSSMAAARPAPAGGAKSVAFAPLFDTHTRFQVKKPALLRFRAREAISGRPIRSEEISFSLQQGSNGASVTLPAKAVKKGVFEVPFTPAGPGQYSVTVAVRGAPVIPAVRLGVVGLAEGFVEVPPEEDPSRRDVKGKAFGRRR